MNSLITTCADALWARVIPAATIIAHVAFSFVTSGGVGVILMFLGPTSIPGERSFKFMVPVYLNEP